MHSSLLVAARNDRRVKTTIEKCGACSRSRQQEMTTTHEHTATHTHTHTHTHTLTPARPRQCPVGWPPARSLTVRPRGAPAGGGQAATDQRMTVVKWCGGVNSRGSAINGRPLDLITTTGTAVPPPPRLPAAPRLAVRPLLSQLALVTGPSVRSSVRPPALAISTLHLRGPSHYYRGRRRHHATQRAQPWSLTKRAELAFKAADADRTRRRRRRLPTAPW